jgi:hypothetical protein
MKYKIYLAALVGILLSSGNLVNAQQPGTRESFTAKRVNRSATILLNGGIDNVFFLFEPEPEKKWADGWNFDIIYSRSGNAEEFMMFQTAGHGDDKALWIITKYDKHEKIIQYTVTDPAYVTVITITCSKVTDHTTDVTISFAMTGLNDNGNKQIDVLITHMYQDNMKDWEEAINYYLANGTILKHH